MREKFNAILLIAVVILICVLFVFIGKIINQNRQIDELISNQKALYSQVDSDKNNLISLSYTISELKKYEKELYDSIKSISKTEKIKIKEITKVEYIENQFKKTDTVYMSTLTDTCYGDYAWYEICLGFEDSLLTSDINVKSDLYITYYNHKETIKPKKIWPLCLFQKKHILTQININEKNPYISLTDSKIVEIKK